MKKVYIIIVNWNGKKDTLVCLDSLSKISAKGMNVKTLVVDNASTDDSVAAIRAAYPDIIILESSVNEGFTGGNNRGIRYARQHDADYVWLLNNDTKVDTQVLTKLVEVFSDKKIGIAGSKIYFAPGKEFHVDRYKKSDLGNVIWYAGGKIDWANMYASHRGVDEIDTGQYDRLGDTDFVTGCSLMIRREVIENIGFLDDRFFLYLEDLDYSLRAKKAGFRAVYVPGSRLWHVNSGSTGKPGHGLHQYYLTRNRLLVGMRYAPFRTKVALFREACRFLVNGPAVLRKAVLDFLLRRFGNRYTWKA